MDKKYDFLFSYEVLIWVCENVICEYICRVGFLEGLGFVFEYIKVYVILEVWFLLVVVGDIFLVFIEKDRIYLL